MWNDHYIRSTEPHCNLLGGTHTLHECMLDRVDMPPEVASTRERKAPALQWRVCVVTDGTHKFIHVPDAPLSTVHDQYTQRCGVFFARGLRVALFDKAAHSH
eukprot:CAMPEP_0181193350 /NCGR_PEP_ID=MMETSP1096-20121128/13771_1 /TAXON_ID=156174 ORGANISM="Chrysochromulina ericina, Strain CCMP281" /NCGR_SAMPLE_ID=MMETSP1096 /ASSEMBLY_ACC=CAM_ASM_000453 /LENGTH=101 /DNA_ID=CAMNT_0023282809 /DNA_START=1404 /DNA_END=1709 /DNA_ORIENTATION=-